jgi:hypothetical protein
LPPDIEDIRQPFFTYEKWAAPIAILWWKIGPYLSANRPVLSVKRTMTAMPMLLLTGRNTRETSVEDQTPEVLREFTGISAAGGPEILLAEMRNHLVAGR